MRKTARENEARKLGEKMSTARDGKDRTARKKKRGSIPGRVCSVTGTAMIVIVILLCSLLVLPGVFGFHMYNVLSGSMEPSIPVGSLLYVQGGRPEDVVEEDVVAFYSSPEEGGIITHRVVKNNVVSGTLRTKGDANEKEDPTPVPYENYIGRVRISVPYVGKLLTIMTSLYGKIAAACVVVLGLVLNLVGSGLQNR